MAMKNAQQIAEKWKRNARAAEGSYKEGVSAVTVSPMAKAAEAEQKWVDGIRRAAEEGTWRDGLMSVDLNEWKRRTMEVGARRYAQGIDDAQGKMAAFMTDFLPFADNVSRLVQAMPSSTLDDRINRAVANMRGLANYKRTRRRSM